MSRNGLPEIIRTAVVFLAFCTTIAVVWSQATMESEVQLRLDLKRAQLNEDAAADVARRTRQLAANGLASAAEVSASETNLRRAEVDTEKARAALMNELPTFRVVSAMKSVHANGDVWVELRLQELNRPEDERLTRSFLVSLESGHSIVSEPYQRQVVLDHRNDAPLTLLFRLLRDADEVTVLTISGARREELPILLQRSQTDRLIATCENFSQQGTLGESVDYVLNVERFVNGVETAELVVEGLPAGFTWDLIDAGSRAKLTLLRFGPDQSAVRIILRVYVPAESSRDWLGHTLPFRVTLNSESGKTRLGATDLQLRPVGWPRLALVTDNLLVRMAPGETRSIALTLENTGGAEARDVTFDLATPIGFRGETKPAAVAVLKTDEKRLVNLVLTSEPDAVAGDYTLRIHARLKDAASSVESPEQSFRVVLSRGANMLALVLVIGICGAVGGTLIHRFRKRM